MYACERRQARELGVVGKDRRKHIRPIADDFDAWLRAVSPALLPTEPLNEAARYFKSHRDALYRFIDDPDVPIDNSPTEREFQNVARLR